MRLNDATPRPVTSACRAVSCAGGRFTPSNTNVHRRPGPSFLADTGKTVDRFSVHREYSILSFHDREEKEEEEEVLVGNFGYFSFQNWKGNGEIEIFIYFILFLDLTFYVDGSIRGFDIHINRLFNYYYFNPTNIYESSMIYSLSDISTHLETRFLEIIYNSVSL